MDEKIRQLLKIDASRLDSLNSILMDPEMTVVNDFLKVVEKYGSPGEINRKAEQAGRLENLLMKVGSTKPEFLADLKWLQQQRDRSAFISIENYRKKVLGENSNRLYLKMILRLPWR